MDQRFGPYQVGETIGRGTFAKVKVAVHEATKTKVALKVIPRKIIEEDPKSEVKIKREIKILHVLRHPHVMRLYDVVQTKHDIILVMEYVSGGELFDYISRRGRLHESLARLFFQQLIAAVGYCHVSARVAHRDLKPENILLEQNMKSIKLGDFGLSSIMRDGKMFETSCGTPNYAAPEVVSGRLYSGREADVWSCGVVLYTMLAGGLPFDDPYVNILFKKIQTASYQMPSFVPKGAQDIISRMLVPDPLERATMEQIVQHPWVREQFPAYLIHIHTDALYQSGRFAWEVKRLTAEELDPEIIAYVATRFRLQHSKVISILQDADRDDHPVRRRRLVESTYSSVDDRVKPEPLVIPLAEEKLRDEAHDVAISYSILLDRKLLRKSIADGSPSSGSSRHVDPNSGTAGVAGGTQGARHDSSGSPEEPGGGASSLMALKFGQPNSSGTIGGGGAQSAMEYGSLRGLSLGPHSHKPLTAAHRGGGAGQLHRAPDGTMHLSPIMAPPAPAPFVDVYVTGFNSRAIPRLEVSQTGRHTMIGALFGLPEDVCSAPTVAPGGETGSLPEREGRRRIGGPGYAGRREPLLKPTLSPPLDERQQSEQEADVRDHSRHSNSGTVSGGARQLQHLHDGDVPFPASGTCRFGADFMRNGVVFRNTDAQSTFDTLCLALRKLGFVWRAPHSFTAVAMRPNGAKIICKVFKTDQHDYLIDVRTSIQSGMSGLVAATELLSHLLDVAVKHS